MCLNRSFYFILPTYVIYNVLYGSCLKAVIFITMLFTIDNIWSLLELVKGSLFINSITTRSKSTSQIITECIKYPRRSWLNHSSIIANVISLIRESHSHLDYQWKRELTYITYQMHWINTKWPKCFIYRIWFSITFVSTLSRNHDLEVSKKKCTRPKNLQ